MSRVERLMERWFPAPEQSAEEVRTLEAEYGQMAAEDQELARSRAGVRLREWCEQQIETFDRVGSPDHADMLIRSGVREGLRLVVQRLNQAAKGT